MADMTETSPALHEVHAEITEESIALLVRTFYGRAREDDLIGKVFNNAVQDWEQHLSQISAFWS